jgi:hypothetical protein
MYCSGCGQVIPAGQQFCSNCGRPVPLNATAAPATWFYTRVHRHIQALSILWIAYAVWTLLHWLIALSFFGGFFGGYFGHWNQGPWGGWDLYPFHHMPWFVPFITAIVIARTILSAVTGFALASRTRWARILAIVAAFLTILKPFTGTALAIYTLWVLLPGQSGQEYDQIARP